MFFTSKTDIIFHSKAVYAQRETPLPSGRMLKQIGWWCRKTGNYLSGDIAGAKEALSKQRKQ